MRYIFPRRRNKRLDQFFHATVVGGTPVFPPDQIADCCCLLTRKSNGHLIGSGVVIGKEFVLTAQHVVHQLVASDVLVSCGVSTASQALAVAKPVDYCGVGPNRDLRILHVPDADLTAYEVFLDDDEGHALQYAKVDPAHVRVAGFGYSFYDDNHVAVGEGNRLKGDGLLVSDVPVGVPDRNTRFQIVDDPNTPGIIATELYDSGGPVVYFGGATPTLIGITLEAWPPVPGASHCHRISMFREFIRKYTQI